MNTKHFLLGLAGLFGGLTAMAQATDNQLPEWAFGGFERLGTSAAVAPSDELTFHDPVNDKDIHWCNKATVNPAVVEKDGTFYLLFRGQSTEDNASRIGLATSSDGVNFSVNPSPVLYPDPSNENGYAMEQNGGCEDPRIVAADVDGKTIYVMTYNAWNHANAHMAVATSEDLVNWTRHGYAFRNAGEKFSSWKKTGTILTAVDADGKQRAAKIDVNGEQKYFMYWGHGSDIYAATSDDLTDWRPIVDESGEAVKLFHSQDSGFDHAEVIAGCAVKTDNGYLLMYNGKNSGNDNLPQDIYTPGQILFSLDNPIAVVDEGAARLSQPFMRPIISSYPYEGYGTVYAESLVWDNVSGKWLFYYSCGNNASAVASYDPAARSGYGDQIQPTVPEGVINAYPKDGIGKTNCFVKSSTGGFNGEQAFYLNYSYAANKKKWCHNRDGHEVVIEFLDYYTINRFVMRDCKVFENDRNVDDYQIFVSLDGEDWQEIVHETGVSGKDWKDVSFEPVKTRYFKLKINENMCIRIYGIDIYGEKSEAVDRGDVVSVGKTILKAYDRTNERESALNLLDGTSDTQDRKWCFFAADPNNDPYKFAVIDLEADYLIKGFRINDCKTLEDGENMSHYTIHVSSEMPNLDLITPQGDSNTCWTEVVSNEDGLGQNIKDHKLQTAVKGRYVKLTVPRLTEEMNNATHRVYAFDVLGSSKTTGIDNVATETSAITIPGTATAGQNVTIGGVEGADVAIYSLTGAKVYSAAIEGNSFIMPAVQPGLYIVSVKAANGTADAKLIVR